MEKVYCESCDMVRIIIKQRPSTKCAVLDCGHIVTWDDDSGTWMDCSENQIQTRNSGGIFPKTVV